MQDKEILYRADFDKFPKRILKLFYPYFIVYGTLLFVPFLNVTGARAIDLLFVIAMAAMVITMFISSYKWTINQIVLVAFNNDLFEVEVVSKDKKSVYNIMKADLYTTLKWQGSRPRILRLSLFDKDVKIGDFYSGGKQKMEYVLEEIAYKINVAKTGR